MFSQWILQQKTCYSLICAIYAYMHTLYIYILYIQYIYNVSVLFWNNEVFKSSPLKQKRSSLNKRFPAFFLLHENPMTAHGNFHYWSSASGALNQPIYPLSPSVCTKVIYSCSDQHSDLDRILQREWLLVFPSDVSGCSVWAPRDLWSSW